MQPSSSFNLRAKQRDVLSKVFNLSGSSALSKEADDLFKVLILDRHSKEIIAPLLRIPELRKLGVTIHFSIDADRQVIEDCPAVYLVAPTAANIERIIADAQAGLYPSMYIHFTPYLPSRLLEQLAQGVVRAGAAQRVVKLFDQYASFTALEPNLFSLGMQDAYVQLNDPSAQDTQIEAISSSIVDGLFSVCVTLGVVPVIRCPKGGVAQHVAELLDNKLRDALRSRNNLFTEGVLGLAAVTISRPLLCLFDRNFDMASILAHTWTYKPMVHDVLGLHLNKVTLHDEPGSAGGKGKGKSYEVDDGDFFWETCGADIFPKMAEQVEKQLKQYVEVVDKITKQEASGHSDAEEVLKQNQQNLMAAVSSVPELMEQKKTIDKHTNIATSLLSAIKSRGLDQWHQASEDLLGGKTDLNSWLKLLAGSKGMPADKLRLAIIWLLAVEGLPNDSDYSEVENTLKSQGIDVSALAYVRTLKRNHLVGGRTGQDGAGGGPGGMAAQSGAALFDYATKAFKTLLAGARQVPLTAALENLLDGKQGTPEFDNFAVFDPKAPAGKASVERAKGPFREAIVFMIGGGNYQERETVVSWAQRASQASTAGPSVLSSAATSGLTKHVIYGATELLGGEAFVSQLAELGKRSGLGPGKLVLDTTQPRAPGQ